MCVHIIITSPPFLLPNTKVYHLQGEMYTNNSNGSFWSAFNIYYIPFPVNVKFTYLQPRNEYTLLCEHAANTQVQ